MGSDERTLDEGRECGVPLHAEFRGSLSWDPAERAGVVAGDGDPDSMAFAEQNRDWMHSESQLSDFARFQRHGILCAEGVVRGGAGPIGRILRHPSVESPQETFGDVANRSVGIHILKVDNKGTIGVGRGYLEVDDRVSVTSRSSVSGGVS